jgi:O-antigen/teichoic acid export membrane protein
VSRDKAVSTAAEVASGGSVVLAGNLLNRALRFATNWVLANALGPVGYGVYEGARNFVTILASFAPGGTDKGVVYFGARQQDQPEQLRGTVLGSFIVAGVGGPLLTVLPALAILAALDGQAWAVWLLQPIGALEPGLPQALLLMLPAVAIWSLLLAAVGTLRALKAMKAQTLAYLVVLPLGMIVAACLPLLGFDLDAVIVGFVLANAAALVVAMPLVWRRLRPRIQGVKPLFQWKTLLGYSLPESFSSMLFRINQWADTLMVLALAGTAETGLYRTAVTLAMIGEVPAVAVNTMFQPVVSQMVAAGDPEQLKRVVRIVTRWMVILAAPVYLGVYVGIEVLLSLWKPEFASSGEALTILLWGQAVYVLTVPVNALIPMSGRARLNLANAGAAAAMNIGLNMVMIPLWGIRGAATATGISLACWSLWRVAQVWYLMRQQAFTPRALALVGVFVLLALGARFGTEDLSLLVQAGATAGSILAFLACAWSFGRSPDDALVLDQVTARFKKKLGLGPKESS